MIVTPLNWPLIQDLAPRLREADIIDCAAHDHDPHAALAAGLSVGPSWALRDPESGSCMGAAGFSPAEGTIWSLWAEDLSGAHKRWIMRRTAPAVRTIVALSGGEPLGNYVWDGNRLTIAWLRASKCFNIGTEAVPYKGHSYLPFTTKPWEELPRV